MKRKDIKWKQSHELAAERLAMILIQQIQHKKAKQDKHKKNHEQNRN